MITGAEACLKKIMFFFRFDKQDLKKALFEQI